VLWLLGHTIRSGPVLLHAVEVDRHTTRPLREATTDGPGRSSLVGHRGLLLLLLWKRPTIVDLVKTVSKCGVVALLASEAQEERLDGSGEDVLAVRVR